jgi:replication factor C subunit 1
LKGKNVRIAKEIQGHMRLRTAANRHAVRLEYLPILWQRMVRPLSTAGKEAVDDVIDFMDDYYLTKEDWDGVLDLGVDYMAVNKIQLESQTKSAFTRHYNAKSHPMTFMKASAVSAIAGRATKKEQADFEDIIEESDEGEAAEDEKTQQKQEEEDNDITKDKYIKAPKKRGGAAKSGSTRGSTTKKAAPAKRKAAEDTFIDDDSEDEPPKKKGTAAGGSRGRGRGRGRGR